ncbi:MAG: ABC transporter ATP-binding protein [Campylobacterales bacterium]|nr:ABC transporter ATP-binding protein [Campylobacterales bacterium]
MLLFSAGTSASAYLVKPVLDEIFVKKDLELLYLLPYAIVFVYFLKGAGKYIQTYYSAYIGQDIIRKIRDRLFEKMMSLDLVFFHKFRSGELISRNVNDVDRIRHVVSTLIPDMVSQGLTALGLLSVVIYQSPKLSFFALIIMPATIIPLQIIGKKLKKISHRSQEKTSDITSKLTEVFTNVEIIKAHAAEQYEHAIFAKQNANFFKLNMKTVRTSELSGPLMETIGAIGVAVVIIIGGKEVIEGTMTVGSFFSFLAALFMLYAPIKRISSLYTKVQDAIAASERIFFVLDQEPTIVSVKNLPLGKINTLAFENVFLKYGEHKALNGVSFEVKKGEKLALVGDSGGGKSSIVNLIVRFFDPTQGAIRLDGVSLSDFNLTALRTSISMVTQRVYIFNDTVAANVAYGKEIDLVRVVQCLEQANASDFVEEMGGVETVLDEHGTNLSGGQRQRIAIARALYVDPQILIFDEATSALDSKSEQKITQAIEAVSKNRITIIIAHRLSTIRQVDKIAVLRHGKIVDMGTEAYLLEHCEEYRRLAGTLAREEEA